MTSTYNPVIKPGTFELYCGPMFSGKSMQLIHRIDQLKHMSNSNYLCFKPGTDTRSTDITSKFPSLSIPCLQISEKNSQELLEHVTSKIDLVGIDEIQFFSKGIEDVIIELQKKNINVVGAGLDLDFRGEPFGRMPQLLSIADEVHKLKAGCQYESKFTPQQPFCSNQGTRTQKLINGEPAPYHSPLVQIENEEGITYQCRCLDHHIVPGKPKR